MPVREAIANEFITYGAAPVEPVGPTLEATVSAGFHMENDMVNLFDKITTPTFKDDTNFDLVGTLKESKYWDNYRDNFLGVGSREEYSHIAGQIEEENKRRQTLEAAGWAGTASMIGAGILSPTMFLPLIGQARGGKAVLEAGALGFAGAALQEAPLIANQQTRTPQEVGLSLAASTVLSGFLGGAVAALRKGEREVIEAGMDNARPVMYGPAPVGAASGLAEDAGPLAVGAQSASKALDSNALTRSPVTSTIMGDSQNARWTMAQLADGGLAMERNAAGIPTTPGGTAENLIQTHFGKYARWAEQSDDIYARYVFDEAGPSFARNVRATFQGASNGGKLSRQEFRKAVTIAGWSGDTHANPYVQEAAQVIRRELFDPMLQEMQSVGLLKDTMELLADPSYIHRLYDRAAIKRDVNGFVDFLAERFNRKLQANFAKELENYNIKQARDTQTIEDVQRPQAEIDQLREQFSRQLAGVEARAEKEHFTAMEDTIAGLRAAARELDGKNPVELAQRKQLLADARAMEENAGPQYKDLKGERAEIRRRLSNFNKAKVVLEERLAKKVEKIDRTEELSMATLNRAARAGKRFLTEMDKWSDKKLDAELGKLKTQFARTAEQYDKGEERIGRLVKDEEASDVQMLAADALQAKRADKLSSTAERIGDAEDLGRDALRSLIDDMLQESLARVKKINDRRAVRVMKMQESLKKLDPEQVAERIRKLREKQVGRETDFNERLRVKGAEDYDLKVGKADFMPQARKSATMVKDKIMGTDLRLPTVDIMQGERGAELTRVLDIPSVDLAPWLETDIDKLAMTHLHTIAPDVEITRKLGSVNGEEQFVKIKDEMNAELEAAKGAKGKDGKPLGKKQMEKKLIAIQDKYALYTKNLEGVIGRLRHNYGLPRDPDGMGYRMAKAVMHANVLRYMGGVTISSIPDIARPVMRFGLTRAFRDGFIPLITNLKGIKMLAREGKMAGAGVDVLTGQRAQSVLDLMTDGGRGSKFEKGLEYASGKMGIVAGFSYWTDFMKGITSSVANVKIIDTIMLADAGKAGGKDVEYLAQLGFDHETIGLIAGEIKKGGGAKVDGLWMPNTEDWTDQRALKGFRSALAREVNNSIVTPGVERPLWTNSSTMGKVLSQFKSFGFSSTYKMLLSGMQQRDMAILNGVMISLAAGALSYYLYGVAKGGKTYDTMMKLDPDRWADEAWARSGLGGIISMGQDLMSRVPLTAPYSSFSGGRTTRRGGDDLLGAALGPSFDFAKTATDIAAGIDDPTQSTLHKARTLLPGQNITGISRLFDAVERGVNLKERR